MADTSSSEAGSFSQSIHLQTNLTTINLAIQITPYLMEKNVWLIDILPLKKRVLTSITKDFFLLRKRMLEYIILYYPNIDPKQLIFRDQHGFDILDLDSGLVPFFVDWIIVNEIKIIENIGSKRKLEK